MRTFASLALCLTLASPLFAQNTEIKSDLLSIPPDTIAVDYVLATPIGQVPGQGPWWGVRLEYDFPPSPWGLELGYSYRGKQFYTYNHDTDSWSGPVAWQQVDSGGVSERDWPFFQTRHVLSPGLVFRGSWMDFRPKLTLGLLVQFFIPSGATDYYPDYQNQFQKYLGTTKIVFGNSLKFGVDGNFWSWLEYGADLAFEVPDWSRFYDAVQFSLTTYVQTNAHFEFRLGVRL